LAKIEDLLQRRSDLSTFLVHFTRDHDGRSAKQNLTRILVEKRLRLGKPLGMAASVAERERGRPAFYKSQQVVSFTETPLQHAWMMCEDIEGRSIGFKPYGIALSKARGRTKGINPVWYLDISRRGIDWLTVPINSLVKRAIEEENFRAEVFKITPYIEQMGPTSSGRPKEFWWEREWRWAGRDIHFVRKDIVVVLAPTRYHDSIAADLEASAIQNGTNPAYYADVPFIDPSWGLERIIARIAGVPDWEAGPYPRY
jgi:hypothetical protein